MFEEEYHNIIASKFSDTFVKERRMSREICNFYTSVNECYFAVDFYHIKVLFLIEELGNFGSIYFDSWNKEPQVFIFLQPYAA